MGLLARVQEGGVLARVTSPDRGRASDFFRVPRIPGIHLDHYSALAVAAVFACVTVIAKNIAQCPWEIVEEKANGDWEYRRSAPAYRIFNLQPNPEMTAQAFKEQMFIVALLWGHGFAEIEWDLAGRPRYLWPLEPERCCLDRDATGAKIVRVQNTSKPETVLAWENVYAISGPGIGMWPFDMVATASRTIAQALAQDQFGLKFYEHGTALGGILASEQPVDQTKLDALRKSIEERVGGADNAFKFLLVSGLKYSPFHQTLRDAQYDEARNLIIEDICRFWGVPPHKIAHLLRATNNNIEHQGLEYKRDTLTRWARFAEQEGVKLFGRARLRMCIDMDELAEGDAKSIAETDSLLVNNGLRTRNELRQKRGWNSLGSIGDVLTVQGATTTLEAVKSAPAPRKNGDSPAPEYPAEPPDNRRTAAAALYANAIKRTMKRQFHRAKDVAASVGRSASDFRTKLAEQDPELRSYLAAQLHEAMFVVHQIGMNGNADAVRRVARDRFDENTELLVGAFKDGNLESWCDIDRRADEIAQSLIQAK